MTHQIKAPLQSDGPLSMARFFNNVPDDIRQSLLGTAAPINLKKDQRLFERGDAGGTMYVVQSGRIEISVVTEAGRKILLNLTGPGHCFGEVSMVDNGQRTASAVALEDTRLQPIARNKFLEALKRSPELGINLMEILCERVRWVSDSVEEYALHSLYRRLARRLIVLHENFALPDGSIEIAQSDLADFAGATRESTNKILMQWKSEGLISVKRRNIRLGDMQKLDQLAYGDDNQAISSTKRR